MFFRQLNNSGGCLINLVDEVIALLSGYGLNVEDVAIVVRGSVMEKEEFLEKFSVDYDNGWGSSSFEDIQLVVDEYTWIERTSYDGCERFILKAHPLLSDFENQESHTGYFYR